MSFAATLPAAILDTILGRLALLFLAGAAGDLTTARHAAAQMLAAYQAESEDELRLAAEIVSFSFHALEALGQAAAPDISLNLKLRLRGSAVSLSRASHKAQRRLDQLQKARRTGIPIQSPAVSVPQRDAAQPKTDKAIELVEATRAIMAAAKANGQTWTQAHQQRQRAKRMTENLRKNQARHLAAAPATSQASPTAL